MPRPSTIAADTTNAMTATPRLATSGSFLLRVLSGVITTPARSLFVIMLIVAHLWHALLALAGEVPRTLRLGAARCSRSCGRVPELAAAVDDRPGRHVDHQGDGKQHQTGGDEG